MISTGRGLKHQFDDVLLYILWLSLYSAYTQPKGKAQSWRGDAEVKSFVTSADDLGLMDSTHTVAHSHP